ncbi:MAG: hypothetical protein HY526_04260 [Betaproteobacteria bacterium]|nr:hypothetical protein [Betaproteobacteria bacterium]
MKVRKTTGIAAALLAAALAIGDAAVASAGPPTYDLRVTVDVSRAMLTGRATIDAPRGAELSIDRGDLRILSLTNGGRRIAPDTLASDTLTVRAEGPLQIRFEGIFDGSDVDVIGTNAVLLRGMWYPVVEGTYRYRLSVTLPRDFLAISEAERVRRTEADGRATFTFDLPHPQRDWDGITFVASRQWASREAKYKDIDLSVHVLRRNVGRLDGMVRQTQRYLQRLEQLLGDYPFKRLVIVENPVPLNYSLSMPTYILLSQKSVAATVREDSALHHEITHQWIGNAVLGDYEGGNWLEGLTSYLSDHLEGEALGIAWERRQRMMAAYQGHVADRAATPLSSFEESTDRASRITGYAKSAIVFHMLRRTLGDERFFAVMRDFVTENLFRIASWADIRKGFERAAAVDLRWFFDQWVEGAGLPELGIDHASVIPAGDKHELRLTVTQKPPVFSLTVPATIYLDDGGRESVLLPISGERHEFRYLLNRKPARIVLDEGYDVFRRLTPAEFPPTINTLITRPRVRLIGRPDEQTKFATLIDAMEREGVTVTSPEWHRERTRKRQPRAAGTQKQLYIERTAANGGTDEKSPASLILLGQDNPLIARLFGPLDLPHGGFTVTILKHPRNPGEVVAILAAESKVAVDAVYRQLIDRPRYSTAVFNGGKLVHHEMRHGQPGIVSGVALERH